MLINNAGFGSTGEFIDNDSAHEAEMIKVNCIAPTILTHHFVPLMKEKGKGALIFLGSVAGFQATPMMTTYSATKVFNRFLGNGLWYELKKYGIDVLSLNPGGTTTEFQRIADVDTGPFSRTPEQVVDTALKALGKKMEVIDGVPNKIVSFISKLSPMQSVVRVAGKSAMKMYNDYRDKK